MPFSNAGRKANNTAISSSPAMWTGISAKPVSEDRIYECHGTLDRLQCLANCKNKSWWAYDYQPVTDDEHCLVLSEPPTCPDCGGLARQNVLMFNDWSYAEGYQLTKETLLDEWLRKAQRPVVIEIGAGKVVPTVRNFPNSPPSRKRRFNPHQPNRCRRTKNALFKFGNGD